MTVDGEGEPIPSPLYMYPVNTFFHYRSTRPASSKKVRLKCVGPKCSRSMLTYISSPVAEAAPRVKIRKSVGGTDGKHVVDRWFCSDECLEGFVERFPDDLVWEVSPSDGEEIRSVYEQTVGD